MLPLMEQTQTAERVKLRWQRDGALRKSHLIAVIDKEVVIPGYHSIWSRVDITRVYSLQMDERRSSSAINQKNCNLNLHHGQL